MLTEQAKMSLKNQPQKFRLTKALVAMERNDRQKVWTHFYYNKVTKKTQWTKLKEDSKMKVAVEVSHQETYPQKMRKRSTVIQSLEDNWQEMKDPKSEDVLLQHYHWC